MGWGKTNTQGDRRHCPGCCATGETLPLDGFYLITRRSKHGKPIYAALCRACSIKRVAEWRVRSKLQNPPVAKPEEPKPEPKPKPKRARHSKVLPIVRFNSFDSIPPRPDKVFYAVHDA
jgi:hypothetical protein